MDVERRLQTLRTLQYILDGAFRVPGTRIRFGWDPIIGLVPGVGDLVTTLFSGVLIVQAFLIRVPRVVLVRMLMNVAIDGIVGAVPLVGDVADAFWKSNAKNMALLERHAGSIRRTGIGDWAVVIGVVVAVVGVAAMPFLVLYWLTRLAMRS